MIGAYVRGRALAPDMLLARCEGQAVGPLAACVNRLPHQAAGHLADMRQPRRHKAESGTAELGRNAEALALADGDVGAQLGWRFQQSKRQCLGGGRNQNAASAMHHLGDSAQRYDYSKRVGITNNRAEKAVINELFQSFEVGSSRSWVDRQLDELDFGLHSQVGA